MCSPKSKGKQQEGEVSGSLDQKAGTNLVYRQYSGGQVQGGRSIEDQLRF